MKNWKRIFTIGIFAFCLIFGSVFFVMAEETNKVYNADNVEVGYSVCYTDISEFRDVNGNHTAPPAETGYVFAGWYSDKVCGSDSALSDEDIDAMSTEENIEYYAKFVSADILSVKAQLRAGTDSTTESTTLRFVTTVDGLDYMEVGFTLVLNGQTYTANTQTVYRRLYAVGTTENATSSLLPTEFHAGSKYFMACNLNKIPAEYFELAIDATPYWITCDGTKVENTGDFKKTVMQGIPLICEALVTGTDVEKYYSTLEKAFLVADSGDTNEYLENGYTVEIIQDAVEIADTLTVYDNITVTNEAERDVTITRNMSGKVFVDNLSTGLTIQGNATTVGEESKGSLNFVGTSDTRGCIDSDGGGNVLTLNNVTIKNFTTDRDGGVIRTTGTAEFTNCTFEDITQTGDTGGGVIYHISGNLTTTGCTFKGNKATVASGAGIYVKDGTLTVDGCDFDTNIAAVNGGAIYMATGTVTLQNNCSFATNAAVGDGGAVYVAGGTLNATSSVFETNKTSTGNGGAIYVAAGTLTESNVTFTGNDAAAGHGGAVCVDTGTVTENGSTFTGNKGKHGAAFRINSGITSVSITGATFDNNDTYTDGKGGAINIQGATETVTIQGTTFKNNDSDGDGGAIYIANGVVDVKGTCEFDTNTSASSGGAIYVAAGTLTENGSTFTNNSANHGGAVRINSDVTTVTITGSTFDDNNTNTGAAYNGGAINIVGATDKVTISGADFQNNDAANFGGAIYVTDGTVAVQDNCTFNTNGAVSGGAIYTVAGTLTDTSSTFTGNTANNGAAVYIADTTTTAAITSSTFDNNDTSTEDSYDGGAVYIAGSTEGVTIEGATFQNNDASNVGGAIYVYSGVMNVQASCSFTSNTASGEKGGGAIYIRTGTSKVKNSSFSTNKGANGGAIYVNNGTVYVQDNSSFTSNEATTGGALYVNKGKFIIQNGCTFSKNVASGNGGAILVVAGTFSDTNSTYTENTGYHGATIRLESDITQATITGSTFEGNYTSDASAYNGGALHINGATNDVNVDGVTFKNNNANGAGGAVCVTAGTVYIQNSCEFIDNSALGSNGGGAVYVTGGTVNVQGASFTSNEATKNGGAICVNQGTLNESGSTYKDNTANHGAGIRVNADATKVTITGTTFDNNDTRTDSAYKGGALNIQGAAETITIEGTTFKNNDANSDGGAICIVDGVVEVKNSCQFNANTSATSGGAIYVTAGTFTENGSTYTQNSANHGGAIRINSDVTTATITGSVFDDNNTNTGSAYNGGAINIVGATDKVTVSGATFQNNDAANFGGAIYVTDGTVAVQDNCSFVTNGATAGGAIYTVAGTLTEKSSTFTGNTANNGAALYVADTTTTVTITGSTFDNNDTNTDTTYDGGAVYIAGSTDGVTIDGATFQNNDASNVGGAIYVYSGVMNVQNGCSFTSNTASGTNGGGAIYIRTGTSTIANSSFATNEGAKGGAIYVNNGTVYVQDSSSFTSNEATTGGAIYVVKGKFIIQNGCTFNKNIAAGNGGAICVAAGTFSDTNSTYTENTGYHGATIRLDSGITKATITGSTFEGNYTNTAKSYNGGALHTNGSTDGIVIKGVTFKKNIAQGSGGAICVNAGTATIQDSCSFIENTATAANGGAVYVNAGTATIKNNCSFTKNAASAGNGGAISVYKGTLNESGSTFTGNTAKHGGAIRIDSTATAATIDGSYFIGNATGETEKYNGGALNIQATSGAVEITNTIFKDNVVAYRGGAIYTSATNITVNGCSFINNTLSESRSDGVGAGAYNAASSTVAFTNTTLIDQTTTDFENINLVTQVTESEVNSAVENISDCDDDYQMSLLTNIDESSYEAYYNSFETIGYTLHSENEMNGNLFRTYATESGDMLHTYWVEYSKEVRTIAAETTALPVTSAAVSETKYTPLLHQLTALDDNGEDGGMGYIIRLSDGRFIVIDGGYETLESATAIYKFLSENAPDKNNIVIAAWYMTHTHSDHSGAFVAFAKYSSVLSLAYGNVTIESVMYNACDTDEQLENCATDTSKKAAVESTLTEYYPNAKVYKPLTGQVYTFAETSIEILYTMSDFLPNTIQAESDGNGGDYNIQSVVSIIDIDNTADKSDRFFVMGDTTLTACQEMSSRYGTYMESDYVQVAHHGLNRIEDGTSHNCRRNGPDTTTYDYIVKENSTIALWPTSQAKFEERTSEAGLVEVNIYLVGIVKENVVAGNGEVTYEFPDSE